MNIVDPIAKLMGEWSANITVGSIILRFFLSVAFSAIIGAERAKKMHEAGLRTFIVISLASTTAGLIDMMIALSFDGNFIPVVSAAAVIGEAILSSNSVLFSSKNQIRGLTTSVALWACGLVGIACGMGYYVIALIGFVAVVGCLSLSRPFEVYIKNRSNHFVIHLELQERKNLKDFVATIRKLGLKVDDIEYNPAYANCGLSVYSIALKIISPELKKYKTHEEIIEAVKTLEYVYFIEEIN